MQRITRLHFVDVLELTFLRDFHGLSLKAEIGESSWLLTHQIHEQSAGTTRDIRNGVSGVLAEMERVWPIQSLRELQCTSDLDDVQKTYTYIHKLGRRTGVARNAEGMGHP